MSSLWQNPKVFCLFFIFYYYFWTPAFYFIEMFMLISLECTLAHTRMGFGRITLPSKGLMRGQYVFL